MAKIHFAKLAKSGKINNAAWWFTVHLPLPPAQYVPQEIQSFIAISLILLFSLLYMTSSTIRVRFSFHMKFIQNQQIWCEGNFWGDKGEGSIQNVENYGIEVPAKTAGLYLVPKLRNLIFWDFVGFGGVWGGFGRNFWDIIGLGSMQNKGKNWVWGPCENPRSLSTPKAQKIDFFIFLAV